MTQALERATSLEQLATLSNQLTEAVEQTELQIRMVQQNIERYENMILNTVGLPMKVYTDLERQYQRLSGLYQTMKSLRGDIDGVREFYKSLFPGFGDVLAGFRTSYDGWANQADQSIATVFETSSVQLDDLLNPKNTNEFSASVNDLLSSPEGRMQAIQAGNQLTAMQLQEARQLRTLLATSIQQQAVINAKQEKMDQAAMEHMREYFEPRRERLDPKNLKTVEPNF